jgi:3'-phosphoadenosine 5'-phosphosulfate sulfotransferase (PAPS reductase)/FAD synthetase
MTVDTLHVDELRLLEAEAVHIIREVVAELERPVLLFSAGKDSIVLLRLAERLFGRDPFLFRSCMSTPGIISTKSSSSVTAASPAMATS